jgi:PAS domain S-box-containing protein
MVETGRSEQEDKSLNILREQVKAIQERFEKRTNDLAVIHELGRIIINVHDFKRLCEELLKIIIRNTVTENCSVMFQDRKRESLYLICASDYNKQVYVIDPRMVFSKERVIYSPDADRGAAGKALRDNNPVLIENAEGSALFSTGSQTHVKIKSLLSVPFSIEGRVRGGINLSHSEPCIFTMDDVNLFRVISDFVGVSLYSSLNYHKLKSSEENFRSLIEYSNNGIAILQNDLHIYANPKYKELTGYSSDELSGLSIDKIIDFTYQQTDLRMILNHLRVNTGNELFNARIIKQNGELLDVEISASQCSIMGE